MKSFQQQSVLTAAIRGKQVDMVRKISNFLFVADSAKKSTTKIFEDWVVDNWYGKDLHDNNPLHYAYLSDLPDIRQILRQSNLDDVELLKMSDLEKKKQHAQKRVPAKSRMNRRSQVPSQMRHEQKCEASSDESDEGADGVSSDNEEEKLQFALSKNEAESHIKE